jgi:hypothetical protein
MAARITARRRRLSGVLAVALVALAVGVSQGLAGSQGNDSSATAPIQYHNGNCGNDTGKKFIGTAKFTLNGDILTVSVKMHGADPGDYELVVFTGECDFLGFVGKFKVDSSGDGEKSGSINVAGQGRSFFADPFDRDHANDSLIVNL